MRVIIVLPFILSLAGCASVNRVTVGAAATDYTNKDLRGRKCPLRVCLMNERPAGVMSGSLLHGTRAAVLRRAFSSVAERPQLHPAYCDIGVRFEGPGDGSPAEVFSAFTNALLFRAQSDYVDYIGLLVCRALEEGSDLWKRIPGSDVVALREGRLKVTAYAEAVPAPQARPGTAAPAAPALELPRYKTRPQPSDFALVIGVEKYSGLPDAPYAERDAEAARAHMEALGVPARNVVLLSGSKAVRSSLEKYLEDWLPRLVTTESRVYFYFSGHGAPDVKTGAAYLVPWDGDPDYLERTGYPVKRLYERLSALPAREVVVALDTCFSGAGGRSVLPAGARPLVVKVDAPAAGRLTVLAASGSSEISGSLPDHAHGAFTYFLLKGLNEGKATARELYEYLKPQVQDEARRLNREQTPQLLGDGSLRLR